MLKFESQLNTESLESLFDTIATVLSEELYAEQTVIGEDGIESNYCLLYTSPSPRDQRGSRMPSSA